MKIYVVKHYFADLLNRLSYYPGETYTTAQLEARGMAEADIEHHCFRTHLEDLATAPPEPSVAEGMNMLFDAAAGANPPEPPAEESAEAPAA